jgi:hypothetical protein
MAPCMDGVGFGLRLCLDLPRFYREGLGGTTVWLDAGRELLYHHS